MQQHMQKLVSNMVIRDRPSIALQRLTDTDVKLYAAANLTPVASPIEAGQVCGFVVWLFSCTI